MHEIKLKHNDFIDLSVNILGQGGSLQFKAHGYSMYPFIRNGDAVIVHPVDADALSVGDIVFYRNSLNRLVAHRIIGKSIFKNQIILRTRGDAATKSDGWINTDQVLGRIVSVNRKDKVIDLNSPFQRFITILWIKLFPVSLVLFQAALKVRRATLTIFG